MLDDTFEVIFLIGFVAGSAARVVYARPRRGSAVALDRAAWSDTALLGVTGVGLMLPLACVLSPWLDFAAYRLPDWAGWTGTAVFAAAVLLLWRSHADLGRSWSAKPRIAEGQDLVTHGIYGHIRHPMYAAHWLWALAQALLVWNWIAGPALLVTFGPMYLLRVRREERMMLDHFGEEYRQYMERTGRSVPRLWR